MPVSAVARRCSVLRLSIFAAVLLGAFAATSPTSALAASAPIAAYSFDQGTGPVAHDLYGNHDGELENGATENALPEWTNGKFGSALRFQGQGYQCVNVPQSPDLELTEAFTIETWVKPEGTGTEEPLIFKEAPTFESHTAYTSTWASKATAKSAASSKKKASKSRKSLPKNFLSANGRTWRSASTANSYTSTSTANSSTRPPPKGPRRAKDR